jgi:hypothetical protein
MWMKIGSNAVLRARVPYSVLVTFNSFVFVFHLCGAIAEGAAMIKCG